MGEYVFTDYPYHFQGIGPDGQELYRWCVQLPCGTAENVDVFFSAENGVCTWTERNAYNEPGEPGCRPAEALRTGAMPTEHALTSSFPNPFSEQTEIQFSLDEAAPVRLSIFSTTGQEIHRLLDGTAQAGTHRIVWDGRDRHGSLLSSGVYFYRLRVGQAYIQTKKLVIQR
ncbi:MAG: T9SS C-terminal target domain-containing protein [Bacteroidetes bacterium]|nr:MAG: T9SS C-terminal target domain-containing protein [Bacteroidota bacterium]